MNAFLELIQQTGFCHLEWRMLVMWLVVFGLLYLAVFKNFEPLLLVPIAFGALIANLPTEGIINKPAGELYSPVNGHIIAISVEERDDVRLPQVFHDMPNHLTQLNGEAEIKALFKTEAMRAESGYGSLIAIIRPDIETKIYQDKRISVPFNGAMIEVSPDDCLVWSDATGSVTAVHKRVGEVVNQGESVANLHSDHKGGLFHYIQMGILLELFPPLIFLGVGALTDFGPLIANPKTLLLGAAAQFGVFATFLGATLLGFTTMQA